MSDRVVGEPTRGVLVFRTVYPLTLRAVAPFINAFALTVIWNWYIPHFFPGMPAMDMIHAFGISLIISFFTHQSVI
jgi:hypothetical protein